ncbi:MAG: NAD(P)H-binding protein [Friedmanniella sp.]
MPLTVLVTGASGFVGSHLATALVEAGHSVRAMTRHPDAYHGAGDPVQADVTDPAGLDRAMADVDVAYYLVHSLDSGDFVQRDADAARTFGAAAARAGLDRIIYLGGLGREDQNLSAHLRSRREVERLLGEGGVPVTVLRAAIVIGHGGISWEITRQLVAHLPAMVVPHWATTRTQPIALRDVIRYLVGVLEPEAARGRVFEIGGSEVLTYAEMMQRVARTHHHRPLPMLTIPLLTPRLSSHWLAFVTDVDTRTARNLVDSMSNEVVVLDHSIEKVVPGEPLDYTSAIEEAYAARARALAEAKQPRPDRHDRAPQDGRRPVRPEQSPTA